MLIVESDRISARAIERAVHRNSVVDCEVRRVRGLAEAGNCLINQDFDVVLAGSSYFDGDTELIQELQLQDLDPYLLILGVPIRKAAGGLGRRRLDSDWLSSVLVYVAQRKQTEAVLQATEGALWEEKEQARVALNAINDAVLISDRRGRVMLMNPVAERLTGWAGKDAVGRSVADIFHVVSSAFAETSLDHPVLRGIRESRAMEPDADVVLVHRNGEEFRIESAVAPVHDREGKVSGAVLIFRDLRQSHAMTRRMAYLAHHDALTGLPNRTLLHERLEQAINLARRHHKQVALISLDLDEFKGINDALGHAFGDRVLQTVAEKLNSCVRSTDTVCRRGSDEFVILLNEIQHSEDAGQVAEKILASFAAPLILEEGQTLLLGVSIGISVFPGDGDSADTILMQADAAMYYAKLNPDVGYGFACRDLQHWLKGVETMERRLFRAFEAGEFVLHYQPQIDLVSGAVVGVEALVRWDDPDRGLIHPSEFLAIAERSGLIVAIGHWVIQQACQQVAEWENQGWKPLPVAVNVSAPEFENPHFLGFIEKTLREMGIEPTRLELEFSERVLMRDPEKSITRLHQLKKMGVRLALDNFGAEGTSLRYVWRFPVDTLKIDQCLISDVTADSEASVVLRSLVNMGRGLKRRLVAEGVETSQQRSFIQAQHFDVGQGFRFAPPQDAESIAKLIEKQC